MAPFWRVPQSLMRISGSLLFIADKSAGVGGPQTGVTVGGPRGLFPVWAVVNKAAVNSHAQVFVWMEVFISLG